MRTLPRGAMLLLTAATLAGCLTSSTQKNKSITGIDADGKKFQLSDYRGKVVLLDFWAAY